MLLNLIVNGDPPGLCDQRDMLHLGLKSRDVCLRYNYVIQYVNLYVTIKFGLYHHLEGCLACGRWGSSLGLGTTFAGAQREATKMVGRGEGKGREGKGREGKGRARKTMYFQLAILLMVRATNHIFHSAVDRP